MYGLNDQRYQLGTEIKSAQEGALFRGKDLSLKRNVLLYQFTDVSNEEALRLIQNVDGFTHPSFFHILDVSDSARGLLVALELREGALILEAPEAAHLSFEQCLEMTLKIGKLVEIALSEGIRDFSLSINNLWLTNDGQLMIINFWRKGPTHFRGSVGLFYLLYQLLSRSTEIPESTDQLMENLQHLQETHSLSDRDFDILNQLYREAFIQSSPSFSFTLLLSQLIASRKGADEPSPMTTTAAEGGKPSESVSVKQRLDGLIRSLNTFGKKWLHKEQLHKLKIPVSWLKQIRIPSGALKKQQATTDSPRPKRPIFIGAAIVLALVTAPLFISAFKGDKPTSTELAGAPLDTEERETGTATSEELEEQPDETTLQGDEESDAPTFAEDTPDQQIEEEELLDVTDEEQIDEEFGAEQEGMIYVPNLIGLSQKEAEQAALSSGLRYSFYIVANEEEPAGLVFEQDLEPGLSIERGARVTFWISRGP